MKALAAAFISALLFSIIAGTLLIGLVYADLSLPELPPPIYIRDDGSIDPPNAPIQRVGDTYTLTSGLSSVIEVQRDNIIIDGAGMRLRKPPVNTDVPMVPVGWLPSIQFWGRSNITIRNIEFNGCYTGMKIGNSSGITITNNTIIHNIEIGIYLYNCSNSSILVNYLFDNSKAIEVDGEQIDIKYNLIAESRSDAFWGGANNSNIIGNNFVGSKKCGLFIHGSFNSIIGNNFEKNKNGVYFFGSLCPGNNIIYHNNFINNLEQFGAREQNIFDNGKEGNYWSDYNGSDTNGDGIGDTPYIINENNTDKFPLMQPTPVPDNLKYNLSSTQTNQTTTPTPSPTPQPTPNQTPTLIPSNNKTESITNPASEYSTTTWTAAAILSVIIITTVFLIYHKKHNNKQNTLTLSL